MNATANHQLRRRLSSSLRLVVNNERQRWMSSSVKALDTTDAVTQFRVDNPKTVMYFTATWCPPCKMIAPIYTSLAETYPNVAFGKIDIDDNQESATEFKISAVPTFVFSKDGETVNKFSGADKAQLEQFIKDL